jgi:hypothetical protein
MKKDANGDEDDIQALSAHYRALIKALARTPTAKVCATRPSALRRL